MKNPFSPSLSQLIALIRQPPHSSTHQPYPKLRNFVLDVMAEGRRKNIINLLFEAEMAPLRRHLAHYKEENNVSISLTTYIAKSLACAIDEDKSMHAYRHGKSKLVLFDEIDLSIMVERDIEGGTLPVNKIVRASNRKTLVEIHKELQEAKVAPLGKQGPMSALEMQFFKLPAPLRKIVWFFIRRDPNLFKQLIGTVGITSMGMHASGAAVVTPITPLTLTLSIGCIGKKVIMEGGHPVEREFIQMNLGADHNIIDGAPLMRFAERFKTILQAGSALSEKRAPDN